MLNKVKEIIEKNNLIMPQDKVLIGVSGGPDSISLLYILHKLGYNICVAHINHGLRENAKEDERYVKEFCEKNGIDIFIKKINLKENLNGMSIEEAGRVERYKFFNEVAFNQNCTKIATAHNSNDQAETVLMNIFRGTGISGLKGIEAKKNNIIRPLIKCSRKEIEKFCEEMKLNPRHDESNDETLYTRNKVRLEVIPYIEKNINSNVVETINRMADLVVEEEEFINRLVEAAYMECTLKEYDGKLVCNLKVFNKLDIVIRKRLIVKFIIKVLGNAKDIGRVHIEDILKLCSKNVGKKYLSPNKNIKIYIDKGKAEFTRID